MGFGSFLKKAINPLTPFKRMHSIGKGIVKGNRQLLKGNFKGALGEAIGGGLAGSPVNEALRKRFGQKKKPGMLDLMAASQDSAGANAQMGGAPGADPMAALQALAAPQQKQGMPQGMPQAMLQGMPHGYAGRPPEEDELIGGMRF